MNLRKMLHALVFVLVFAVPGWTDGFNPYIAGIAISDSDSSCTGSLILDWHCENTTVTSGTPAGCGAEDTTAELESGAAIDTDDSPTPVDGSGTLYLDGTYSRAEFNSMTSNLIQEGKVTGYINPDSFTDAYFLYIKIDNDNYVNCRLIDTYGDARLSFAYKGNTVFDSGTMVDGNGQSTVTSGEWFYFEIEWKADVEGNDISLKLCDEDGLNCSSTYEKDADLTIPVGSIDFLEIGYSPGISFEGHVDAIKIYDDSQY